MTRIAFAGIAVATAGLIHLAVAASQETTRELIAVLSGSSPRPDTAVSHVVDPWGLGILLIGAAMVVVAMVAKLLSSLVRFFRRLGSVESHRDLDHGRLEPDQNPIR